MEVGRWVHSLDHDEPGRILETSTLWGETMVHLWLVRRAAVVRVPIARIATAPKLREPRATLAFGAAAGKVVDALARDALVAPLEGKVVPLPHQLHALQRALSGDRIRYLLADEVGLGKTIEAGLILRELQMRGLARRILVVAPTGLVTQWVSELRTHFEADFRLVQPSRFAALREAAGLDAQQNLWRLHDRVICSLDSVKPMASRRGWTKDEVARYNRDRFESLIAAGWDLVIIDEAHRLAGSTEDVARYQLGEALSLAAPYVLLLSATPHQGKSDAFRRLIGLLDPGLLEAGEEVTRELVAPLVIRTEKRRAINAQGAPLFRPRTTQLVQVAWTDAHSAQQALYEAVTSYVREGYGRAVREKKLAVGFLMVLFQRLVTSSTAAIRSALEKRAAALSGEKPGDAEPERDTATYDDVSGELGADPFIGERLKSWTAEMAEVNTLLALARRAMGAVPDAKAEALLQTIHGLERESRDPNLKVLVFAEFVATQAMLAEFLEQRGFSVVSLNGGMDLDERKDAQRRFAGDTRVLVSTDAGGEGLNLQFCHVVVNYDLPWNPMKLEQRIGRVDRIGQKQIVRAVNLTLADTVEERVREVLEQKLELILSEFGVDKLADVLDSEEGGASIEALYAEAVHAPEEAALRAEQLAAELRLKMQGARTGAGLLPSTTGLTAEQAQEALTHPLPHWTERMVLAWLRMNASRGADVRPDDLGWELTWPGGTDREVTRRAVFTRDLAEQNGVAMVSIEEPRVRGLLAQLPTACPGQAVARVVIAGISERVTGLWSLWRVALDGDNERERRVMAIFVADDGRVFAPTARLVWDRLIDADDVRDTRVQVVGDELLSEAALATCRAAAEREGATLYEALMARHRERLKRERQKAELTFTARRKAIARLGLAAVKSHRLARLAEDEAEFSVRFARDQTVVPELRPLMVVRVVASGVDA